MIDRNKRQFFQHLKGQFDKAQDIHRYRPRPPTAIAENEFIHSCSGCKVCVDICPREIIYIDNNNLATLNLELNFCDNCKLCQLNCPTQALSAKSSDTLLRPKFTSNCDPKIAFYCGECSSICPNDAIFIEKNQQPQLETTLCNGCNMCVVQCPKSAIHSQLIN